MKKVAIAVIIIGWLITGIIAYTFKANLDDLINNPPEPITNTVYVEQPPQIRS